MIDTSDKAILIQHPNFSAKILKQGAQIIEWKPQGKENIFWHVDMKYYHTQKPFRGGVPICWPWFGKVATPSHGFARTSLWDVESSKSDDESVEITLSLKDSDTSRAIWNHPFLLRVTFKLSQNECSIMLHAKTDIETTGALHTYFRVDDIQNCFVQGLGDSYLDSLDHGMKKEELSKSVKIEQEVDRIYTASENFSYLTCQNRNELRIEHINHSDVVLWNPWYETAATMKDMNEEDTQQMLCIESARISQLLACEDSFGVKISFKD